MNHPLDRSKLYQLCSILMIAVLLGACSLKQPQASFKICEVKLRSMSEDDFLRISDYLQPEKTVADRLILRSQPDALAGNYFILICKQKLNQLPAGTSLKAKFRLANSREILEFEHVLDPIPRTDSREIYVGITGQDLQLSPTKPTAWEFTLKAPNGYTLCRHQSFLWSIDATRH